MRLFYLSFLLPRALAELSQGLFSTLAGYAELNDLVTQIKSCPQLFQTLSNANNFTLIAPTNGALSSWLSTNRSRDLLEATLTYHILQGTYASASLKGRSKAIPTYLTNTSFTNVTGGQRLIAFNNGHVVLESGIMNYSNVITPDIPTLGGLIHIVDTVLEIPLNLIGTIPLANLSYAIEIATKGNYLNLNNNKFSVELVITPDLTILLANSAAAVAHFNTTGKSQADINKQIEYHTFDRVLYSTDFSNGTELMTRAGLPVLITVDGDGAVYVNAAKVTSFDTLIANGVFHTLDDILDPNNITRHVIASNQTAAVTPIVIPTTSPTNTLVSASLTSSSLSLGVEIGIGAGAGAVIVVLIVAAIFSYRRWRVSSATLDSEDSGENMGELSGNYLDEVPQLETSESAVELPNRSHYAVELPIEDYYEIGRAF